MSIPLEEVRVELAKGSREQFAIDAAVFMAEVTAQRDRRAHLIIGSLRMRCH